MMIKSLAIVPLLLATTAQADTSVHGAMPAISGGLEVGVALGSSTSTGDVGDGVAADELIGTAAQLEVKVGHRLTPHLAIMFYTAAQGLAEGNTTNRTAYSGTAGLAADFHLRPHTNVDPFVSIGGGLAAILTSQNGTSLDVGVELARLQLGVDFRLSKDFALAPVIGASAVLYGAHKSPMVEFARIEDRGINWTFSAGVAGRFNAFGTRK